MAKACEGSKESKVVGLIAEDIIQTVIDRCDIVDVIGRYVTLKKYGSNFKALCPFHHEKTPSFVVNPDKQIFHCFGCGVGGNVVGFVMRQERLEFPQAVRLVASQVGIPIPEDQQPSGPSKSVKEEILKANEWALQFFHEKLLTSREAQAKAARDYLKGRGVNLEIVKQFRLGYAPDEWEELIDSLKRKNVSSEVMHQAGLVIAREKSGYYDRFRGRIIFPIFDILGRPVAFGARALPAGKAGLSETEGAKYINSPETPVYTKGRHLFGLHLTKTSAGELDRIVIVEGYMDMIMPFTHGVKNIAASLGTALTVDQIRLIRRYTSNVIMLFDTDTAGQAAIVRSLDGLVDEGMNVKVVTLDANQDPDSFIRKHGVEGFHQRLRQAVSLFDYKLNWLQIQYGVDTIEGKSQICQHMLSTIGRYKDEVIKYELSKQLAKALNLPEAVVLKQAGQVQPKGQVPTVPSGQARGEAVAPVVSPSTKTPAVETLLLTLFLKDPSWVKQAHSFITPEDFSEGLAREIIKTLWQLAQEHQEWSVNDLLWRIDDTAAHNLITGLMNQEEAQIGEAQQVFDDCIKRIHQERLKKQRRQLIHQIEEAEARSDASTVEDLRNKFQELIK